MGLTATQKFLAYHSMEFTGSFAWVSGHDQPGRHGPLLQGVAGGMFWVRLHGGHNVRRRSDRTVPTLADPIVGRADSRVASITTFAWLNHAANSQWIYLLTSVGGLGVENDQRVNVLEVVISSGGSLQTSIPNMPKGLRVIPKTDGSFDVTWVYDASGQGTAPTHFYVYSDSGTGTMDYTTPVATVAYVNGQAKYTANSGVLAGSGDTIVEFGVRAGVSGSNPEQNALTLKRAGRTTAPYGTVLPAWTNGDQPDLALPGRIA